MSKNEMQYRRITIYVAVPASDVTDSGTTRSATADVEAAASYACDAFHEEAVGQPWHFLGGFGPESVRPDEFEFCDQLEAEWQENSGRRMTASASLPSEPVDNAWTEGGKPRPFPEGLAPAVDPIDAELAALVYLDGGDTDAVAWPLPPEPAILRIPAFVDTDPIPFRVVRLP